MAWHTPYRLEVVLQDRGLISVDLVPPSSELAKVHTRGTVDPGSDPIGAMRDLGGATSAAFGKGLGLMILESEQVAVAQPKSKPPEGEAETTHPLHLSSNDVSIQRTDVRGQQVLVSHGLHLALLVRASDVRLYRMSEAAVVVMNQVGLANFCPASPCQSQAIPCLCTRRPRAPPGRSDPPVDTVWRSVFRWSCWPSSGLSRTCVSGSSGEASSLCSLAENAIQYPPYVSYSEGCVLRNGVAGIARAPSAASARAVPPPPRSSSSSSWRPSCFRSARRSSYRWGHGSTASSGVTTAAAWWWAARTVRFPPPSTPGT
jgi:hypothetical protein